MFGQVSYDVEVDVPAGDAWELYSTLQLAKVVQEGLSPMLEKVELVEGDGGVGTVVELTLAPPPGAQGPMIYKEKFTKIDNEKRIKETEVVEGGFLDLGFTLYRVCIEIVEKDKDSCVIKLKIEYDVKEEAASNASMVTTKPLEGIASVTTTYLLKMKNANANAN
ncbi:hypothetical protein VitviT2T_024096 [Vitis vinifera]|uniref:Bet v I/Major latex protein domain-containing protein n=2 Tax=Vitis vinifera TaxID=29760 RepID=A0ABY9DII2_VITVI|eukprot:XP_002273566.1 PREDICTED: S-norcoclaurine synthase 2 [Vitis vinifera]